MKRVLDASVTLKWFLDERPEEELVGAARALFVRVQSGQDELLQPVHWCAEVLSVLARAEPEKVDTSSALLKLVVFSVADSWEVYQRGARIAVDLNHHLFDTLYHAVALEHDAEFVTADKKYFHKARSLGAITLLG